MNTAQGLTANDTNAPPGNAETCGNCRWGAMVKEDLQMVECHALPPQIILMGMAQTPRGQQPAFQMMFPRTPRQFGCTLFKGRAPAFKLPGV